MKTIINPLLNLAPSRGEHFDTRLMCRVDRIAYDLKTRTGYLDLPDGSCTDMGGAIELFQGIDAEVRLILAGDICYFRLADGTWQAGVVAEEQRIPLNNPSGQHAEREEAIA